MGLIVLAGCDAATDNEADAADAIMPNVVCMNLQDAQDLIQESGNWLSLSKDATGADRMQIRDSNWFVVAQTPETGTPFGEGDAVLSVLKHDDAEAANFSETCAAQPSTTEATGTSAPTPTATPTTAPVTEAPTAIAPPVTEAPATVPVTEAPTTTQLVTYVVVNVVDGDTLDLDNGERVRLVGIDTPERGECGYDEATMVLASMVLNQAVTLEPSDEDRDKYGRLLRYVVVNGVDAGGQMLTQGYAITRYNSTDGYGLHPREAEYEALVQPSVVTCAPVNTPAPAPVVTPAPAPTPPPAPPTNVSYA